MILTNVAAGTVDADLHAVPTVHVQNTERAAIYGYVSGTANPTARLSAGVITAGVVVAPDVASFSSRGPALAAGGDMLKPDIMAPGVAILAAVSPASPAAPGRNFDFYQGTSMSSPHIAGIGALMKQRHPDWSPMMIKSALMTTASQLRNNGTPIAGGVFAIGSGHVDPNKAVDPGLVYDAGFNDWLGFLCGSGQLTGCGALTIDPSDLNYPSIAIGSLVGTQVVTRKVTNVGGASATYTASVVAPAGLTVSVSPTSFTIAPGATQNFTVTFTRTTATLNAYAQGSITWNDGTHVVRSPFAVRPVILAAPAEVTSTGSAINYPVSFGYTGAFGAQARGLVAATTTAGTVSDDPGDDFGGIGAPGTTSFPVVIPTGTTLFRVALFDGESDGADDLDLYVYQGTTLIGSSGGTTSAERVTFTINPASAPIPLTVVVHGLRDRWSGFQLHAVYLECRSHCGWKHGGRRACNGHAGCDWSDRSDVQRPGGGHSLSRHGRLSQHGELPGNQSDHRQRQHALTSNAVDIETQAPGDIPRGFFLVSGRLVRDRVCRPLARTQNQMAIGGRVVVVGRVPHTQDDAPSRNQRLRVLHLRLGTAERAVSPGHALRALNRDGLRGQTARNRVLLCGRYDRLQIIGHGLGFRADDGRRFDGTIGAPCQPSRRQAKNCGDSGLRHLCISLLSARSPVAGLTREMRDSQDQNELRFDRVVESERKNARETSPDILISGRPGDRIARNALERLTNHVEKPNAEPRLARFVVLGGALQFRKSLRVKLKPHCLSASRTCLSASLAGMVVARPDLTSSRLRFASASQARSILPSCAVPRLSTRRSASSARPSVVSSMAF